MVGLRSKLLRHYPRAPSRPAVPVRLLLRPLPVIITEHLPRAAERTAAAPSFDALPFENPIP
jgi:hypothetical protein